MTRLEMLLDEATPPHPATTAVNALLAKGPRKKHSHRCRQCGQAVYCYKTGCTKPQRIEQCEWCKPVRRSA